MDEKNELGILRETSGLQKGYVKDDVDKYTNQLTAEIKSLNTKVKTLESQLEEANDKLRDAEEALSAAKSGGSTS